MNMRFSEPIFAEPALVKPRIAYGVNAGKPRPVTDQMPDQAHLIKNVIAMLKRNGFEVIGAHASVGLLPSVQVATSRKTAELIACGKAVYYIYRMDAAGVEMRQGQCHIDGVRVVWFEHGAQGASA